MEGFRLAKMMHSRVAKSQDSGGLKKVCKVALADCGSGKACLSTSTVREEVPRHRELKYNLSVHTLCDVKK